MTLFTFAAAAPGPQAAAQCNGGSIQCCNQAQEVETVDKKTSLIMQLIGIDTSMVGSKFSPLSIAAIGGHSCTSQLCCQDNHCNAFTAVGCTLINLSL